MNDATERASLEGALEALSSLHEDLILRRDEARDESARETYDEVLTVLDSLETEYRRRHAALPPVTARHASYVFLLDEHGEVHPVPHALYMALARGNADAPDFAGKTLRLADWYVLLKDGEPETVVNEAYSLIAFDGEGRVDWSATPSFHAHRPGSTVAPKAAALPTAAERERIRARLFEAKSDPASTG